MAGLSVKCDQDGTSESPRKTEWLKLGSQKNWGAMEGSRLRRGVGELPGLVCSQAPSGGHGREAQGWERQGPSPSGSACPWKGPAGGLPVHELTLTWAPLQGCGRPGCSRRAARVSPDTPSPGHTGQWSGDAEPASPGTPSRPVPLTQQRMISQTAWGGASVFTAFLQACDRDTRKPAWRRADLRRGVGG